MRIAMCNMKAAYNDIDANKEQIICAVSEDGKAGAQLVLFPEFCLTGFGLDKALLSSVAQSVGLREWFLNLSKTCGIAIGGSFLEYEPDSNHSFNTYGLFFPGGESYFHRKDIPTALENFCYRAGDEDMVFDTPLDKIGVAMCWEQLRSVTVQRIKGKADFVVAGSCWWGFSEEDGAAGKMFKDINRRLALQAPMNLAKILGVPVYHSSISGSYPSGILTGFDVMTNRPVETETTAFSAGGEKIRGTAITTDLIAVEHDARKTGGTDLNYEKYWIPDMPELLLQGFEKLNEQFAVFYDKITRNILKKIWSETNG